MTVYKVVFASSAIQQLKKLDKSAQKLIVEKVKNLDIRQSNSNIKKLIGVTDLYRLRVGNYRVIYQVRQEELIVLVLKIGYRNDVYRGVSKLSWGVNFHRTRSKNLCQFELGNKSFGLPI